MSAYLYDKAIVDDLRRVCGDDRITITPVDNVYNVIPRIQDDKFKLPLITLTRTNWSIKSLHNNHSAKFEGALSEIAYNPKYEDLDIKRVQFVDMYLSYAIDVWTRTRAENDEIVRELYWYYLISPTLQVTVPYDLNFNHVFTLSIDEDIEDNSDIAQHAAKGEMFRQTINIYTDDARLWKSSSRGPTYVDISFDLHRQTIEEAARDNRAASERDDIQ